MESIYQCNRMFKEKTLHPLASVIDLSSPCDNKQLRPDSYCIMVMTSVCKKGDYGLRGCDYTDGTLLFNMPSKVVNINQSKEQPSEGKILLFHPSLLVGTPLGKHISSYSFFKYRNEEALHVSSAELRDLLNIISDIEHELKRGIDEYSATILSNSIELLLNYCLRFYHRQFIMRHDADNSEFERFATLLDDYLTSGRVRRTGMPCGACRFTPQMYMSAAYLNDLVRNETGKNVAEYAQLRRLEIAKQMLQEGKESKAMIALRLGIPINSLKSPLLGEGD